MKFIYCFLDFYNNSDFGLSREAADNEMTIAGVVSFLVFKKRQIDLVVLIFFWDFFLF